ncbi:alginate lyase family protein [Halobacillus fulvus]|nr:alginate lyase family protein [Halobacillus fulvus]
MTNAITFDNEQMNLIYKALPGSRNKDHMKSADLILDQDTYMIPPFGVFEYPNGIEWDEESSRGFLRLLHGHSFLGCLTAAYESTGEFKYLNKAKKIVLEWVEQFDYEHSKNSMAFHDETTALRLNYWIKLHMLLNYEGSTEKEDIKLLERNMWETADLLSMDYFHSTNTNHGMFQDISLLFFSLYFNDDQVCPDYKKLAIKRLRNYFSAVYTEEGVHKEHSPSYHLLVTSNLKKIIEWFGGIAPDIIQEFSSLYSKTETFSTAMIKPDGYLPSIGDTEAVKVLKTGYRSLYTSEEYLYAVTGGKQGLPPEQTDFVFQDAGYAIFRNDWSKKEEDTYVLFSAAYHGDYHKHSDDLNVLIYSDGNLLTDAGPNGYNYKDPFTEYAYSSFAHNTLLVDGKGLPRVDKQEEKVYMDSYHLSPDESSASGVNSRFEDVTHQRTVKYNKIEESILVEDSVESPNRHDYTFLWHLSSDLDIHVRDKIVEAFRDDKKVAEIEFSSESQLILKHKTGEVEPDIQGWSFPKMETKEESTVIEVHLNGKSTSCKAEFRLNNFKLQTRQSPFKLEKNHQTTRNVRYHFEEATDQSLSDQLIVVFSAIGQQYQYKYNYMKALEHIPTNKLFILDDFGDQGSYYIGENRDFSIETAVSSLIQYKMAQYSILNRNVTTIGSSKGGYAALYFGLKYYFGHVLSGAPQTKMGQFLLEQADHPNIAKYVAGGIGNGDKHYLNQLMYDLLNQSNDLLPTIDILIGKSDHHYENHILPLFKTAKKKNIPIELHTLEGVNHDGIKNHFPPFIIEKICSILGIDIPENIQKMPEIDKLNISLTGSSSLEVNVEARGEGIEYAYYLYKDNEVYKKFPYIPEPIFKYTPEESGEYLVRVFVRNKFSKVASNTKSVIVK